MPLPGPAIHSAIQKLSLRTETHTTRRPLSVRLDPVLQAGVHVPGTSNQQHPESRDPGVEDVKQEGLIPLPTAATNPLETFCCVSGSPAPPGLEF